MVKSFLWFLSLSVVLLSFQPVRADEKSDAEAAYAYTLANHSNLKANQIDCGVSRALRIQVLDDLRQSYETSPYWWPVRKWAFKEWNGAPGVEGQLQTNIDSCEFYINLSIEIEVAGKLSIWMDSLKDMHDWAKMTNLPQDWQDLKDVSEYVSYYKIDYANVQLDGAAWSDIATFDFYLDEFNTSFPLK